VIPQLLPHPLEPPAWSLATEFHFYLLLPLLFRWRPVLAALLVATVAVQLFGFVHESTRLNGDGLGYHYIFGVLPVFLMGYLLAEPARPGHLAAGSLWLLYATLCACAFLGLIGLQQRASEVTLGASIALPLLAVTVRSANFRLGPAFNRWDERLGDLAYPIFITHCLAFYIVEHFTGMRVRASAAFLACAAGVCLSGAILLASLQRHVETLRIALRGFASMKTGQLKAEAG
jgi:peptidoglycan/LPS O-acetylase OafA/YrhL